MSIVCALTLLCEGLLITALGVSAPLRAAIAEIFAGDVQIYFLVGALLVMTSIALLTVIYLLMRSSYCSFIMGGNKTSVAHTLVQNHLSLYWKNRFPQHNITSDVTVCNNTLEITAHLPIPTIETQEQLLKKIEEDLEKLFSDVLSYDRSFIFNAHFL